MTRRLKESSVGLFSGKQPKIQHVHYSGDKPNSHLRSFVENLLRGNASSIGDDSYSVGPFTKKIDATKSTAVYNMHSYHQGKKPHDAIQEYIRHYTKPGDLILDPFSGSGSTALAALLSGRNAIAIDRSPAATFITKNYCTPVSTEEFAETCKVLLAQIRQDITPLYETKCGKCGGSADISFTVYSQAIRCSRCLAEVPLADCPKIVRGKKEVAVCPYCKAKGIEEEISSRSERLNAVPVMVSYICRGDCRPARRVRSINDKDKKEREYFKSVDLERIKEISKSPVPFWYPNERMMHAPESQERWGVKWRAGTSNFRTVSELFTKRNLWAIAAIRERVIKIADPDHRDLAMGALTGSILHLSRMSQHKSGGGGIMVGTYYVPPIFKERNAVRNFSDKLEEIIAALEHSINRVSASVCVSTQSACDMNQVPSGSVDYIFTDPPYADTVQYGELNFVWEAWMKLDTHWHEDEIVVNEVRGKSENDWAEMMLRVMKECYRILKPGRWLSLCYHDTSEGTWELVQDLMSQAGFIADRSHSVVAIDTAQKSYNQYTADKVTKRDLVINFRKPRYGESANTISLSGKEDKGTFMEKVRTIITDYLEMYPGASKDRIYDEVVSRMVRTGTMEVHNFDELLRQVAEEVKIPIKRNLLEDEDPDLFGTHAIGRWYLKSVSDEEDAAESAKEDEAGESLANFIKSNKKDYEEGVHYSELFEHYIYGVKDKPRRQLVEWLPDYFFKTEAGTWRLPMSEEEEKIKRDGRLSGVTRRIRRYIACIEAGLPVSSLPSAPTSIDLAGWVRHCKRAGLYEQGRILYEKGGVNLDHLAEDAQVNLEEDYQMCVRMLGRETVTRNSRGKRTRKTRQEN